MRRHLLLSCVALETLLTLGGLSPAAAAAPDEIATAAFASPVDKVGYLVPGTYTTSESTWFDSVKITHWDSGDEYYATVNNPEADVHAPVDMPLKAAAADDGQKIFTAQVDLSMSRNGCPYVYGLQLYPYRDYVLVKLYFPDQVSLAASGECRVSGYRWHFLERRYELRAGDYTAALTAAAEHAPDAAQKALWSLHLAALTGDSEGVATLLGAHPELLDSPDWRGRTPLRQAVEAFAADAAQLLLQHGADPYRQDLAGVDALSAFLAAVPRSGVLAKARALAQSFWNDPALKDTDRGRLLAWLVDHAADLAGELLPAAPDLPGLGDSLLVRLSHRILAAKAVDAQSYQLAGEILKRPTSVTTRSELLIAGTYLGALDFVKLFAAAGVNVNQVDASSGLTPLGYAITQWREPLFSYLLTLHPDVNQKTGALHQTPLMLAAGVLGGNDPLATRMLDTLLHTGAQINSIDDSGFTVLDHVTEQMRSVTQGYTWISDQTDIKFLVRIYKWLAASGALHKTLVPPPPYILNLA